MTIDLLPCDVRNDDTISPEENIRSLTIMGKVLDIDCLLIQDKDVPSHTVSRLLELAQVDRVVLVNLLTSVGGEEEGKQQQQACLW